MYSQFSHANACNFHSSPKVDKSSDDTHGFDKVIGQLVVVAILLSTTCRSLLLDSTMSQCTLNLGMRTPVIFIHPQKLTRVVMILMGLTNSLVDF